MELRLSCTNQSIWKWIGWIYKNTTKRSITNPYLCFLGYSVVYFNIKIKWFPFIDNLANSLTSLHYRKPCTFIPFFILKLPCFYSWNGGPRVSLCWVLPFYKAAWWSSSNNVGISHCAMNWEHCRYGPVQYIGRPILGLHSANERRRYKVTASLIGWVQT